MQNQNAAPSLTAENMFSLLNRLNVTNNDRIPSEDRDLCQRHQRVLYLTLDQIKFWYDLFKKEAGKYQESHKLTYKPNGKVETHKPYSSSLRRLDYRDFEFKPFEQMNKLVDSYFSAVKAFSDEIIKYFNKKYSLSVPCPDLDKENMPIGFYPDYNTYLDGVINHLGGMGFQQKAEQELIARFHKAAHRYNSQKLPALKTAAIMFADAFSFDTFYLTYNECHIAYNYSEYIHGICEGIVFAMDGVKGAGISSIQEFDGNKVDITKWYSLSTEKEVSLKFYKNGRLDVKFPDRETALSCWNKLKMDEIGKEQN